MTENQIGKKINQFRKEKGLTIKDFSEMSGISTALVSQLERGIGNPTLSVLRQICLTLETSMSSLFFEGFSQHFEEEIAYLVEGDASIVFEDEEFLLHQGDTVRILPSRKHKMRNDSAKPVQVLFIKSKVNC